MFTGIVTAIGRLLRVEERDRGRLFTIAAPFDPATVALGASIAHDGICLTVTARDREGYRVFAGAETLARTTAARWSPGRRINLEPSLRLGDELGGHFVFGHVDAVAQVVEVEPLGDSRRMVFTLPAELAPLVAVKGSIAVDGVSLTVNEVAGDRFAVLIIPHTLAHTTLGERVPGDPVNLEADMLARYVARQLALRSL